MEAEGLWRWLLNKIGTYYAMRDKYQFIMSCWDNSKVLTYMKYEGMVELYVNPFNCNVQNS